jgi:hypothetical protein
VPILDVDFSVASWMHLVFVFIIYLGMAINIKSTCMHHHQLHADGDVSIVLSVGG